MADRLAARIGGLFIPLSLVSAAHSEAVAAPCGNPALVTIDIGHTPKRGGATSARGVPEYVFNKRLAGFLARRLDRTPGFQTRVLNPSGRNISLRRRADEIAGVRTGVLLSIHHDSAQLRYFSKWTYKGRKRRYSDKFSGHSLFVSSRSAKYRASQSLGSEIGRALRGAGLTPTLHHAEPIKGENRPLLDARLGLYDFAGLRVLRSARVPAVLIEAGMIVNRQDELVLGTERFIGRFTGAVVSGLKRFCNAKG